MGFIRNALIGIVLYEVVVYALKKRSNGFFDEDTRPDEGYPGIRKPAYNSPVQPTEEQRPQSFDQNVNLTLATDPEVPLTGTGALDDREDPWKNSLANDDLRAPDS